MIDRIRTDEALQVLVFVCAPLLLLLVVVITMLVRGSRRTATFPTFSVTISSVGPREVYVMYRDASKNIQFRAEIGKGKNFFVPRIYVQVPKELSNEELRDVVPNVAQGLAKLPYEYLIYRKGEPQAIPEEERNAAIAELRQMGFELKELLHQGQVQVAVTHHWHRTSRQQAKDMLSQVQSLTNKARGIRENVEVLARSDAG